MRSARPPRRFSATILLAIAAASALVPGQVRGAGDESPFKAGAASSNITPFLGSSINGGMTDRTASDIHDELHARCLVLDDGESRIAFAVCDSCMIPREVVVDAKERIEAATGIAPDRVLISATHSHSCPTSAPVFQSTTVEGYPDFLAARIADGVRRAVANLEPAEIGWGSGTLEDQVFNRRWRMDPEFALPDPFGGTDRVRTNPPSGNEALVEPAGPIDPEVAIVSVRAVDGRPIALLANYSLHYVGGTGPGEVSADYYGIFADRVSALMGADRLDPPFVAMMSNGTSGDINNVNFREPREDQGPYAQMRAVAEDLAAEAARVAESLEYRDRAALDAKTVDLELGVRKADSEGLARARSLVERAEGPVMRSREEIYARESILLDDYPDTVPLTIQAITIGGLGIAAIPCEVFVEIGLEIKARSLFNATFTVSLANGYNGYLPTESHHELGGYETWRARSSYLEVGAASEITEAAIGLLDGLHVAADRP